MYKAHMRKSTESSLRAVSQAMAANPVPGRQVQRFLENRGVTLAQVMRSGGTMRVLAALVPDPYRSAEDLLRAVRETQG